MEFSVRLALLASIFSFALVQCASAAGGVRSSYAPARNEPRANCANAYIIGIRGNSTGDGPNDFGLLDSTMTKMHKAIPGSVTQGVGYPRVAYDNPQPTQIGRNHLLKKIKNHASKCPDTPIVIAGYSLGGIIAMNTICSQSNYDPEPPLNTKFKHQIIAVILYGEESRVAGQPYDEGTCTQSSGEVARDNPHDCAPYASRIKSWCDFGDPLCCAGYDKPYANVHAHYPGKYDEHAVHFVTKQYKHFKSKHS